MSARKRPARPLPRQRPAPHAFITGGAGFIGANLAHRLASQGRRVLVLDSLARPGVERNLAWLKAVHGDLVSAQIADVRDARAVTAAVQGADMVFHLAAQVAVTTSVLDPRTDFEVNAAGTLNILEALRGMDAPPPLVFTSTNKVYGKLAGLELVENATRYSPADPGTAEHGVAEDRPLDFYSPYGCSKGAADQYVLDYARIYGLPAVSLRMSCIYGPHQRGTEDQGWVAHFLISALEGRGLTIYGNGKQVRDVLWVEDLVEAFLLAVERMDALRGKAFNIGGGPDNAVSLVELLELMGDLGVEPSSIARGTGRPGDQAWFVADTRGFSQATGWRPRMGKAQGVAALVDWLKENRMAENGQGWAREAMS